MAPSRRQRAVLLLAGVTLLLLRAYLHRPAMQRPQAQLAEAPPTQQLMARAAPHIAPPPPPPPPPQLMPRLMPAARQGMALRKHGIVSRRRTPAPNPIATASTSQLLLFMMRTASAEICEGMGLVHVNHRSCKRPCEPEPPPPPASPLEIAHEGAQHPRWREASGDAREGFAGNQSLAQRSAALEQCDAAEGGAGTFCGFLAPSVRPSPLNARAPGAHPPRIALRSTHRSNLESRLPGIRRGPPPRSGRGRPLPRRCPHCDPRWA